MPTLPHTLSLSLAQFSQVCANNPEARPELDADCTLKEMSPTGGSAGARNTYLLAFSGPRCDPASAT
jgi:Uma2 family endonuclease